MSLVLLFSCFERFLGFLYRIYLSHSIGAENLGIYQITLSVVGVLVTLTASGTPITVSRLIMKYRASGEPLREKQVISSGILTAIILSLPISIILFLFRPKLSFLFADERCYDLLLVILPGVVLTSVYSVIRGVFWGNKKFFIYSLIELCEEIVMLVAGVIIISNSQKSFGFYGAGIAILVSYIFSFFFSTIVFILQGNRLANPIKEMYPLLNSSTPITIMRTAMSLLSSIIATVLPQRLIYYGYLKNQALASFGEITGMALPLLFTPSTIIGSIALVLVPELSENYYNNNFNALNKKISKAINCSVIISALIMPVFFVFGEDLGELIYSNLNAGIMLKKSAIIMLPMSVTMITTSILNSLNKEKTTLGYYLIGSVFLMLSVYFLPKYMGVYSLIFGYAISYVLTAVLNIYTLDKIFKDLKYKKQLIFSFLASVLTVVIFNVIFKIHNVQLSFLPLMLCCMLCVLSSCIFLVLFGVITFDDIKSVSSFKFKRKNS